MLSADENGISAEGIKESLTENNQLAENAGNGIQTYALGEEGDVPATIAVEPKQKEHYIVVLDPGHDSKHAGAQKNGVKEEV